MNSIRNKNKNFFQRFLYITILYVIFLPWFIYSLYTIIWNNIWDSNIWKKVVSHNYNINIPQKNLWKVEINYLMVYRVLIMIVFLSILIGILNNSFKNHYITKKTYLLDFLIILILQLWVLYYFDKDNIKFYSVLFSVIFLFNLFFVYSRFCFGQTNNKLKSNYQRRKYNYDSNLKKIDYFIENGISPSDILLSKDEEDSIDIWKITFDKEKKIEEKVDNEDNLKELDQMFGFNK